MKAKPLLFDVHTFLAKIGPGRTMMNCRKNKRLFSQGDPADAIFYIQSGKVKLTVISKQGKEAVVGILGANDFFGEGCLAGQSVRIRWRFTSDGGAEFSGFFLDEVHIGGSTTVDEIFSDGFDGSNRPEGGQYMCQ